MRKLLKKSVMLLTCCAMAGCSTSTLSDDAEIQDAKTLYGCNVINVYNAGEYIGEDVLNNFEKLYTAKVNYDTFESNEIMYTKLLGGSAYDVIVPSDYMIERMISEDMLQPLDKSAIPNLDQLDPAVVEVQKGYDPDLTYAAPYFHGSVGIVYNTQTVDKNTIESEGWDILHDSTYKGQVYMYDSQRDAFMVAFKALGFSMNTDNDDEIQQAYQWLLDMNDAVEPAYVTDEVIDSMVNGDKSIAVMYSGDAAYVISENSDMAYIEPYQGTNIWQDSMVIPKNAKCSGLANAYINYIEGYDASYDNSETVGYTSPNLQVYEDLSGEDGDYFENSAYTPREGYANDESFHYNAVLVQKLSDLWNKVKIYGE
ncbi:MAG: ABC transporter substrate-binding protein [Solobacterium sp.]|nr:ABC transporter substrate-binding protein [Solobacterium sp.]MCH4222832.1 ABC transporter substrate-binding protein [Solobacterium sp.]MCH4266620.1 ABC transporter substrate-binding protein [Solobacterium sp.]